MIRPLRKFLNTEILTYNKLMRRYCTSDNHRHGDGTRKIKRKRMSNGKQETSQKDQKLLSITGEARDKVIQTMMASTPDKPTVVFISNPGDVDFVHSFLHDNVRKVVCFLSKGANRKNLKSECESLDDRVSCVPVQIGDSNTHMLDRTNFSHYKGMAVKVLTKIRERSKRLDFALLNSLAYHNDTVFLWDNLECYFVIPQVFVEVAMAELYMANYPPFFKFSEELKLHATDFDPKFTFPQSSLQQKDIEFQENAETIVLLKMEPRHEILNYLPTIEDRYRCAKLFELKRKTKKGQKLSTVLNDLFPGCLEALCDHGYYINTLVEDINTAELFYIYLILKETPGFEESTLYS